MLLKIRHSHSHSLVFLSISVLQPGQSQSTLYNHHSTHIPFSLFLSIHLSLSLSLSLLFLNVSGWLMTVLFLQTFPPPEGKSKCPHTLSEPSHFYDLENPAKFGIPNRILRNTAKELLKTLKIRNVPRKPG